MDFQFTPTGAAALGFKSEYMTGLRLATWLAPAGNLHLTCQVTFEQIAHPDPALSPGRPVPDSIVQNNNPIPITSGLVRIAQADPAGQSTIEMQGLSLVSVDPRLSKGGFSAHLLTFKTAVAAWNDNQHAPQIPRLDVNCQNNDQLDNIGTDSSGLFSWNIVPLPGNVARPGAPAQPLPNVAWKPIKGDLDTSGAMIALRTERTKFNDPLPMILSQLCSGNFALDLKYKANPGINDGQASICTIGGGGVRKPLLGLLYEQVWGRFQKIPCWTYSEIAANAALPNNLLEIEMDEVIPRGTGESIAPFAAPAEIEERLSFVFPPGTSLQWP